MSDWGLVTIVTALIAIAVSIITSFLYHEHLRRTGGGYHVRRSEKERRR